MSRLIDLTGQRFGRLVVKERLQNGKWLCKCDCGNEKEVVGNALTSSKTKSCGCYNKDRLSKRYSDLTGKRFGKLVAIEMVEKPSNKKRNVKYWLCKCDCGGTKVVGSSDLTHGNTKTCGACFNGGDIIGQRFGMLVVREFDHYDKKTEQSFWLCDCDCGNTKIACSRSLKTGDLKTCGCKTYFRMEYGKASKNHLYRSYYQGAIRRGYSFELSEEDFFLLTQQRCFYCGCLPNTTTKQKTNFGQYVYNGVDRVDNNKGYTIDNCVPCCSTCNFAKREMSQQEFYDWIERVHEHIPKIGVLTN